MLMFSSLFSVFSALLLVLSHSVRSAPISEIVVTPVITNPTAATVWHTGATQNVTWDTSGIPVVAQNYTVTILLGYLANGSEHLDVQRPLAAHVPILKGLATFVVPTNLTTRNDYIVALIGDSGDISQPFTIISSNGTLAST